MTNGAGSALQQDVGQQDDWQQDGGGPSRTERKRAARMARIERTAARVFAEKGYDGANFDDIAAELDLRGSSLYHYFPSKEDLFLRCVRYAAEQVFPRLKAIAAEQQLQRERDRDVRPSLRALIREQVLIEVRDFPEFVPLFFKISVPVPELRLEILALRREHAEIFEGLLDAQRADGSVDLGAVRVWFGTTFGALAYLPEWYDPAGPMPVDELAERMSATLIGAFPPGS
jgi:TetR/AcrR family transcriptional regulator, cholesterol catabolism regulator